MNRACISILIAVGAIISADCMAGDLGGRWSGNWSKAGDALPVTVTFQHDGDGYTGWFDSDALEVANIPLSDIHDSKGSVHFLLKGDESTSAFDGVLSQDGLKGNFRDGSMVGTFDLKRAETQAPTRRAKDVRFESKGAVLAGTLLSPNDAGPHRAIVLLQGSGPEGRWANRYLAQRFVDAGFAALIYDKRGVGQSTGDWHKAGPEELADDAVAGIGFLRGLPGVDGAHIGIYGHSQGGTITPLVAISAGHLGFVIAASAGGLAPADVETYSVENSIGLNALAPADRKDARTYVETLIDVAYRGADRAKLDAMQARFKARKWYFEAPPPDNYYWAFSRAFSRFDPPALWRRVTAPVLLLYGAADERIPALPSSRAIASALALGGNRRVTVKIFSNADHSFVVVAPRQPNGWPKHAPDQLETMLTWARAQP